LTFSLHLVNFGIDALFGADPRVGFLGNVGLLKKTDLLPIRHEEAALSLFNRLSANSIIIANRRWSYPTDNKAD